MYYPIAPVDCLKGASGCPQTSGFVDAYLFIVMQICSWNLKYFLSNIMLYSHSMQKENTGFVNIDWVVKRLSEVCKMDWCRLCPDDML